MLIMWRIQILDPLLFTPGSRIQIRDPGWGKNPDARSGINIPDHISKSLGSYFLLPLLGSGLVTGNSSASGLSYSTSAELTLIKAMTKGGEGGAFLTVLYFVFTDHHRFHAFTETFNDSE
jgi:hypothetical protein